MKKRMVFLLALVALLCFAMPAIASPPVDWPSLEAIGPVASVASGYIVQELAPVVAVAPDNLRTSQVLYFDPIAMTRTPSVDVNIATAATLAGLMHGANFSTMKTGIAEGYCLSASDYMRAEDGSRRWVYTSSPPNE